MLQSIGLPRITCRFLFCPALGIVRTRDFLEDFLQGRLSRNFGLTMMVPLLNYIMLLFLAFSDWPALKKRNA